MRLRPCVCDISLRPTDFSAILASRSGAPVASDAWGWPHAGSHGKGSLAAHAALFAAIDGRG